MGTMVYLGPGSKLAGCFAAHGFNLSGVRIFDLAISSLAFLDLFLMPSTISWLAID